MHYSSIRIHLRPYIIVSRRKTTINHAFAAAIAPNDKYDAERVRDAILILGQDPEKDLICAYCGTAAKTWDHIFATVRNSNFSGYGHRLGNLLPCCKQCNSAKGNKDWRSFISTLSLPDQSLQVARINSHIDKYNVKDSPTRNSPEYTRFLEIREQILSLLGEADELAKIIREKTI